MMRPTLRLIAVVLALVAVAAQVVPQAPRAVSIHADRFPELGAVLRVVPVIAAGVLALTVIWMLVLEQRLAGLGRRLDQIRADAIQASTRAAQAAHESSSETATAVRVPIERRLAALEQRMLEHMPASGITPTRPTEGGPGRQ